MVTDGMGEDIDRRAVLRSMGVAGAAGVGGPVPGALGSRPVVPQDAHENLDRTPVVRGSTEQVLVIGADADATLELRRNGALVDSAAADRFGSHAFRGVDPGEGYTVVEVLNGDRTLASNVEVFGTDYVPPQQLYDDQTLPETQDGEIDYITVRDGTELACQVDLPAGEPPYPTVIIYDGYAPSVNDTFGGFLNAFGFAFVGVNKRGTQCSGGKFDLWERVQWLDGYDIVETVATQDWADKVGMIGASYSGYSQLYVAATQPPSLEAIAPGVPVGDFYRDVGWPGGMLNSRFAASWANNRDTENVAFTDDPGQGDVDERVQTDDLCYFNQLLRDQNRSTLGRLESTPYATEFYNSRSPWEILDRIDVPTLLMTAWQDDQVGSRATRLLERFDTDAPVHYIGINGHHQAMLAFIDDIRDFMEFYLTEEVPGGFEGPYEDALAEYQAEPYRIYWEMDQSETAPRPRFETSYSEWPPGETWTLYLQPDGSLAGDPPAVSDAHSSYEYVAPAESDQQLDRDAEDRLVWTADPAAEHVSFVSEPLGQDRVCVGSALAELWVRAERDDTDLQVDLIDVRPDGQEMYVQSGWLRASHRAEDESLAKPRRPWHTHLAADTQPMGSGFERLRVELFPFGHMFRAGSRVKIAVTNPGGTRDKWAFDVLDQPGTNDVAHSSAMSSRVELPLVANEVAPMRYPECGTVRHQPCRPSPAGPTEPDPLSGAVGPPRDVDGDGRYEIVSGGDYDEPTALDVQLLFERRNAVTERGDAWAFSFSGSQFDRVTVADLQALFDRVVDRR
jgi:predicted acyl esterase